MPGSITAATSAPTELAGVAPSANHESSEIELSVVMPCLNEARTLPTCIAKIQHTFRENGTAGEILVTDNGYKDAAYRVRWRVFAQTRL